MTAATDSDPANRPFETETTVEATLEVNRPASVCYDQLLRVEEFPRFMSGIHAVKRIGSSMTMWTSVASIQSPWKIEFYDLQGDHQLCWRRVDGPPNDGIVNLDPVSNDRTKINFRLAFGAEPIQGGVPSAPHLAQTRAAEDLYRFKRLVETRPAREPDRPRRVDLPCSLVGFSAPPVNVHLKFMAREGRWTVLARSPPGSPPAIARWLEPFGPRSIRIAAGLSPRVLYATFDQLPESWTKLLSSVELRFLMLTPDGTASTFVDGPQSRTGRFVSEHQLADPRVRSRFVGLSGETAPLTARQSQIISLAVALGYYEVPHKLNLQTLAQKLNLSTGTVSEALRRAEASIVTRHVDGLSESSWGEGIQDDGNSAG